MSMIDLKRKEINEIALRRSNLRSKAFLFLIDKLIDLLNFVNDRYRFESLSQGVG